MQTEDGRDFFASCFATMWIGVSENGSTPTGGETTLAGEITDGSLTRAPATLVHTAGSASLVLTRTVVSDRSVTLRKIGIFDSEEGGALVFIDLLNQIAILESGDSMPVAANVNIAIVEE